MDIKHNLDGVRARIAAACARKKRSPDNVKLVAVTKERGLAEMKELAAWGVKDFGENRVDALAEKKPQFGNTGIAWHFIGNIQGNKAKQVAELSDCVHSVASLKVADWISARCVELGKRLPIFLEVNMSGEASKQGMPREELPGVLRGARLLPGIKVLGLMTMAPLGEPEGARPCFELLAQFARHNGLPDLSMGMTNDYEVAVEEGATFVRIGSALFK